MGNRFNYRCPKCGSPDEIDIAAIVTVRLTSTGSEGDATNCGPEDWTGENVAGCGACGYSGTVKDFERNPANTSLILIIRPVRGSSGPRKTGDNWTRIIQPAGVRCYGSKNSQPNDTEPQHVHRWTGR